MFDKIKHNWGQIVYTVFTVILLCTVIFTMIGYIYSYSEEEGFRKLSQETQQLKSSINLQMLADRENLSTMSNFASKLYLDGDSFDLMFQSYEEIGLVENIGILLPDNRFITKIGALDIGNAISFAEEAQKGEYISGRVKDLTNPEREVVRSAMPITANGETVAILYGVIELETLAQYYADDAAALGAELYILEGGNGNFIVDTKHGGLGNVTALASIPYKKGFSYSQMITELSEGTSGYSAFLSQTTGEYIYAHYTPLELGDWQIMLSKPEQVVFAGAKSTGRFLAAMFFSVLLIMIAYLAVTSAAAKRKAKVNIYASIIRKRLLELSWQFDSIRDALEHITVFARSRSAFFVDSHGEDYNNITPSQAPKLLMGEERTYFIQKLMNHVTQNQKEQGVSVQIVKLAANKKLRSEMPDFYDFFKKNGIKSVHFSSLIDNTNNTGLIGVINPRNAFIDVLLKDIAVCFSMAVYNRKHLTKTEAMALTDSLTGLANRMAYKQDIKELSNQTSKQLACIYMDVNELHYFNNKHGHAAGDQMLIYIAEVLGNEFSDSRIYRMGGDEFLIFTQDLSPDAIEQRLADAKAQIEEMKYHISIGTTYMEDQMEIEELVKRAEKKMYEDKAKYYEDKNLTKIANTSNPKIEVLATGIKEVDACLSIMSKHYLGAYCVSLKTDRAITVLAPTYYFMLDNESHLFSEVMKNYIHDIVNPDFHRTMLKFLDYEILERQLQSGHKVRVSYTKIDGEKMVMSIYAISQPEDEAMDTVWIFEKEDM